MSFGMWLFENKRVMKNVDCIGYVVEYNLFLKVFLCYVLGR